MHTPLEVGEEVISWVVVQTHILCAKKDTFKLNTYASIKIKKKY